MTNLRLSENLNDLFEVVSNKEGLNAVQGGDAAYDKWKDFYNLPITIMPISPAPVSPAPIRPMPISPMPR